MRYRMTQKTVFAALTLAAVGMSAMSLRECLAIDRCLDHGGRWNYEGNACER